MKKALVKIKAASLRALPKGRINKRHVDATVEHDIAVQQAEDAALVIQDAAKFAQRVRKRLGMTQLEFSDCLDVPLETIRNWEQGKRSPTGAAKTLLKILDRIPEIALMA